MAQPQEATGGEQQPIIHRDAEISLLRDLLSLKEPVSPLSIPAPVLFMYGAPATGKTLIASHGHLFHCIYLHFMTRMQC